MMSGCVRTSRSLLPLRSAPCCGEPAPAEVGLGEAVLLDQRAHGTVEYEDPLPKEAVERLPCRHACRPARARARARWRSCAWPGVRPLATSTVNGSPRWWAPTSTRASWKPAPRSAAAVRRRRSPASDRRAGRASTSGRGSRRSSTSSVPPGASTRCASRSACCRDPPHGAAPGPAAPRRCCASSSGSASSTPRFHTTLRTSCFFASSLRRLERRRRARRPQSPRAPSGPPRR